MDKALLICVGAMREIRFERGRACFIERASLPLGPIGEYPTPTETLDMALADENKALGT